MVMVMAMCEVGRGSSLGLRGCVSMWGRQGWWPDKANLQDTSWYQLSSLK